MGRASGGPSTFHWIRNDIPDFQGAILISIMAINHIYEH